MREWLSILIGAGLGLSGADLSAQGAATENELTEEQKTTYSYGIGFQVGQDWKSRGVDSGDIDMESLVKGIQDSLAGSDPLLPRKEYGAAMRKFQQVMKERTQQRREQEGKANKEEAEAFLEENRSKVGVVTLPSGLQYKVLEEGSGASPGPKDEVRVHYRGTLLDGSEFDSSYERGKPATFKASQVIDGWTQALTRMKEGSKWRLFIPPELAYGERGQPPQIGPNQALIFEVELISVEQQEPVTSDIIRVPSKEELEQGAEVEVIRKEDLEKEDQGGGDSEEDN